MTVPLLFISYLKRLEEPPAAAAILHLVIVPTEPHHGLAIDVQLLVKRLQ